MGQSPTANELTYVADIPPGVKLGSNALGTSLVQDGKEYRNSTYLSSKPFFSFIFYDYQNDPLLGLQYVGLTFTILMIIYSIFVKLKGHFSAEEANTMVLHMVNFTQVVYLFKYVHVHSDGMYHFLNGFGFMHILFFPNFFWNSIPKNYMEYPAEKSLIPDGNFVRNAGSSLSFLVIVLITLAIATAVSFAVFKKSERDEMPQIRKITRIGLLLAHFTFLNIAFSALAYLIQPHVSEPSNTAFERSCFGASVSFTLLIPLFAAAITYHFYKTYNSDVLEHYYTIR